jgi:hypothetical protein
MNCTVCGKPHTKEEPLTVDMDQLFCELHLHHPDYYEGESGIVFPGMQGKMGNTIYGNKRSWTDDPTDATRYALSDAIQYALSAREIIEAFHIPPQLIEEIDTNRPSK